MFRIKLGRELMEEKMQRAIEVLFGRVKEALERTEKKKKRRKRRKRGW